MALQKLTWRGQWVSKIRLGCARYASDATALEGGGNGSLLATVFAGVIPYWPLVCSERTLGGAKKPSRAQAPVGRIGSSDVGALRRYRSQYFGALVEKMYRRTRAKFWKHGQVPYYAGARSIVVLRTPILAARSAAPGPN